MMWEVDGKGLARATRSTVAGLGNEGRGAGIMLVTSAEGMKVVRQQDGTLPYDTAVECEVLPCMVYPDGATPQVTRWPVLPGKKRLLRGLKGRVEFWETVDGKLLLQTPLGKWAKFDREEEPKPPTPEGEYAGGQVVFPRAEFVRLAGILRKHGSKDETRPILTYAQFEPTGEAVATDTYRMFIGLLPETREIQVPITIPCQVLAGVAAVVQAYRPAEVRVEWKGDWDKNHQPFKVKLGFPGYSCWCQPCDGEFPNWRKVATKKFAWQMQFDAPALCEVLRTCLKVMADYDWPGVAFDLHDGWWVITGPPDQSIECRIPAGPPDPLDEEALKLALGGIVPKLVLNPEYLLEALEATQASGIQGAGAIDSVQINGEDGSRVLLMPQSRL